MFLIIMVVGLVGLLAMALPAFAHSHGSLWGHGVGRGVGHGLSHGALRGGALRGGGLRGALRPGVSSNASGARGPTQLLIPADAPQRDRLRLVPSPRAVFTVLAVYGAFGNAAVGALHLRPLTAAFAAALPALLVEWTLARPLWNLVFRFQAAESSPLEQLALTEAEAVVPFRNGRGIVSTVRDGRRVQLSACLRQDQLAMPVRVGDRLLIEDVNAAQERVTVSILQS